MSLKKNLIANYIGQGWTALMSLAFIPLYIKYLGIEAYGLIGIFALIQAWLAILDMGMTPVLSREMSRFIGGAHNAQSIRDLLRSIEVIGFCAAILMALVIWAASGWLASGWLRAEKLPVEAVAQAFTVMGIVAALRFFEGIYRSCIIGLQRQVFLNVISSVMATLRGGGAVAILVWISPSIKAFFIWQGMISIFTVWVLAIATYHALPSAERAGHFSLVALRKVGRFAGGMVGITLLALLLTQVDKILLSKLLTLSDFGYYTLAAVVAGALYMLAGPIGQAWFPRLSELHARNDEVGLIKNYHQGAQLVTVIMGSAAIVLIVFAETILQLWTQDAELAHHTAMLVSLLAVGNLLNGMMAMPYQVQIAYGWTGFAVRVNIVAVLVIVPAILWVTPRYGAEGAAWVWVSLNAGYVLISIHFMHKKILSAEKWRWYVNDIIYPLLLATLMALAARGLTSAMLSPIGKIISLGLGVFLTLGSATLAAPLILESLICFVRKLLSK